MSQVRVKQLILLLKELGLIFPNFLRCWCQKKVHNPREISQLNMNMSLVEDIGENVTTYGNHKAKKKNCLVLLHRPTLMCRADPFPPPLFFFFFFNQKIPIFPLKFVFLQNFKALNLPKKQTKNVVFFIKYS